MVQRFNIVRFICTAFSWQSSIAQPTGNLKYHLERFQANIFYTPKLRGSGKHSWVHWYTFSPCIITFLPQITCIYILASFKLATIGTFIFLILELRKDTIKKTTLLDFFSIVFLFYISFISTLIFLIFFLLLTLYLVCSSFQLLDV